MFQRLINFGVRPDYATWEVFLTRKLNYLSLVGSINVLAATILFYSIDLLELLPICLIVLVLAIGVFLSNRWLNYIIASYLFTFIGALLIYYVTAKLGLDSLVMLFYFPVLISLVQMLGRKETFLHFIIMAIAYGITISLSSVLHPNQTELLRNSNYISVIRVFNIILSFASAVAMISMVTHENIKQERMISGMLTDKNVLLAEVYHRVKNNMNIVTSLLNLKKNTSDNPEVHEALDDCRNRIYSMALIHEQMVNNDRIGKMDFQIYLFELMRNLEYSLGGIASLESDISMRSVAMPINIAVPFGLIINELITNSYKHAQIPGRKLIIRVKVTFDGGNFKVLVSDNGPGVQNCAFGKNGSLGFELIRSLCDQVDATYGFENNEGCVVWIQLKNENILVEV